MSQIVGKIYVAGHRGMVGSAVCRRLANEPCDVVTAARDELDLCDSDAVESFFADTKPDGVVFAAARVGGIVANNTNPVEFLSDNVLMSVNAINAAFRHGVGRLLYLGSTCIYPRDSPQPLHEDSLLSGPLEQTNEAYALAKIVGVKLCQYYRRQHGALYYSALPTNLYGPGDNYHPEKSHVLPALIRRFHEAKVQSLPSVTIWGTGSPRREFLYVDDLADAVTHLLGLADPPPWVNVGTGSDQTILETAKLIAEVVGYDGAIMTDPTRPNGTPVKRTDVTRLRELGWRHQVGLQEGLQKTYESFCSEMTSGQLRSV